MPRPRSATCCPTTSSAGFLGDYPREDFVRAFDAFTSGAARARPRDIDLLTASRFEDAVGGRRHPARRPALLPRRREGRGRGIGARWTFGFEAERPTEGPEPFTLSGPAAAERTDDGTWSVFGYDVARDDAAPAGAEATP